MVVMGAGSWGRNAKMPRLDRDGKRSWQPLKLVEAATPNPSTFRKSRLEKVRLMGLVDRACSGVMSVKTYR